MNGADPYKHNTAHSAPSCISGTATHDRRAGSSCVTEWPKSSAGLAFTAARWLATGRETLIGRVRAEIRNHLKLSESEYDSIVALVRSELDVTVGKHLAETIAPDVGTA